VVQRGFPPPRPFADLAPAERIVAVIRDGKGRMRPMAEQVGASDAWAIAHHVARIGAGP
jgi:mono/diheme cytochrome c family protein